MFRISSTDDVEGLIRFSNELFERHGIEVGLSGGLDEAAADLLVQAIAGGFHQAIALPPASWQHERLHPLATAFAGGGDWDVPHLDVDAAVPLRRPSGPYLLLLRPDGSDDDLRGLTAPAVRKLLGPDACLTIGEYLVVQRAMFERNGDHRFDDYVGDPSGWMWLADSMVGERTAMAYWYGPKRRIEVTACKTGSKNVRKGARRCRVVPLS